MIEKKLLLFVQHRADIIQPVSQDRDTREPVDQLLRQTHSCGSRCKRAISFPKRAWLATISSAV